MILSTIDNEDFHILQGFSVITIRQNDLSNGIVGFAPSSKLVTVNEDTSPAFTLTLARSNAKYGDVVVSVMVMFKLRMVSVMVMLK